MDRYGDWDISAGENLSYGPEDGTDVVMALFVDDGVPDRGHRVTLFKENLAVAGGYSGSHRLYREMTCINYAGFFVNDDSAIEAANLADSQASTDD